VLAKSIESSFETDALAPSVGRWLVLRSVREHFIGVADDSRHWLSSCRQLPTAIGAGVAQASRDARAILNASHTQRRFEMPIILWLLGVPLTIVLLLMLFGVL
jgi:hypothetical protein